jgi:hypothetical protein
MKNRRYCGPLAALLIGAITGCSASPTAPAPAELPAPTSLSAAARKGGPGGGGGQNDAAVYTVAIAGDISGGPESRQDDTDSQIVVTQPGIELELAFFQTLAGGTECFADGGYLGSLDLHNNRKTPTQLEAFFFFWATGSGSEAETSIKYQLTLGGGISGNWPPAVGETTLVTGGTWILQTEGRGKQRIGCTGSGDVSYTISVTRDS